jgi:hypothetical protein
MIDFLFWKRERKGRSEAHTPFIRYGHLPVCNKPTRALSLLVTLSRVTRSRIRGPAVTFPVTARFRCLFFSTMYGIPSNGTRPA